MGIDEASTLHHPAMSAEMLERERMIRRDRFAIAVLQTRNALTPPEKPRPARHGARDSGFIRPRHRFC